MHPISAEHAILISRVVRHLNECSCFPCVSDFLSLFVSAVTAAGSNRMNIGDNWGKPMARQRDPRTYDTHPVLDGSEASRFEEHSTVTINYKWRPSSQWTKATTKSDETHL